MKVQPYLFFGGRCEEALTFYSQALGAEIVALIRYKDGPDASTVPPGAEEKIMHGSIRIGETELMASDGRLADQPLFEGVALTISARDAAEAERRFAALEAGGTVRMRLEKTFFAERFGMVDDKFGLTWMVMGGAVR